MSEKKLQQLSFTQLIDVLETAIANGELSYELYAYHGQAYAVTDRIARTLTQEELRQDVVQWYHDMCQADPSIADAFAKVRSPWQLRQIAQSLVDFAKILPGQPPALIQGDCNQIAFSRLNFVVRPISKDHFQERAPVTAEFLSRMDRPERFAAFIAKTVIGGNRKQAMWFWGESDAYKSTYIEHVVGSVFKKAYANLQSQHFAPDYQWLEAELEGKCLVQCDEAKPSLVEHDKFKMLTGAQQVMANVKYGHPKHVRLECHFVFTSNKPPSSSREAALKARLLPVHIKAKHDNSMRYEERVMAYRSEFEHLVCYGAQCLMDGATKRLDDVEQNTMVHTSDDDMDFADIIETHFTPDPNGYVTAAQFSEVLKGCGVTSRKGKASIIDLLRDDFSVRLQNTRIPGGKVTKVYTGISLKFKRISD